MSSLFCCGSIQPCKSTYLAHQSMFTAFMEWASFPKACELPEEANGTAAMADINPEYVVQLVRQVNYGPLESRRYFARVQTGDEKFIEVTEKDLIEANFEKLNSHKNHKCIRHNRFFEVNVYQKDPVNQHHWRANLARPASNIDL